MQNALSYSHQLLKEVLQPGDLAVDATMGNGHDTLFLAQLVGRTGHVYACDLQEQAIQNTKKRLEEAGLLSRATLLLTGHETLDQYLPEKEIKGAIFNLGYLPQSDKAIITQPETTLLAIQLLLDRLSRKGRVVIVCYYGHSGGLAEMEQVRQFCKQLSQKEYAVLNYQFINQQNQPPLLFCIEKK